MAKPIASALFAAACVLGGSASFAANMHAACQVVPCVYDPNNKIIGILQQSPTVANVTDAVPSPGIILREINGVWYQVEAYQDGLYAGEEPPFYYGSATCSGQPYFLLGSFIGHQAPGIAVPLVNTAYLELTSGALWAAQGSSTTLSSVYQLQGVQCASVPFHDAIFGPAVKIETPSFRQPFTVR